MEVMETEVMETEFSKTFSIVNAVVNGIDVCLTDVSLGVGGSDLGPLR